MSPSLGFPCAAQVVVSDGSIIQDLLDSPETFNTFCKNVFNSMEKKSLVLDDILMCVRMVRSQLGLPPPSKMKQHVTLIEDLFKVGPPPDLLQPSLLLLVDGSLQPLSQPPFKRHGLGRDFV